MPNQSSAPPHLMRYSFPARVLLDGNTGASKRFRLQWGKFIKSAKNKAPLDQETLYALELFNEIEFRVSLQTWNELETRLASAESLAANPRMPTPQNAPQWACESAASSYFSALYSSENHPSQAHPDTLCMIAKYLFSVQNVPLRRAVGFTGFTRDCGILSNVQHAIHEKVRAAIQLHWKAHFNVWLDSDEPPPEAWLKKAEPAQVEYPKPIEYAQVPDPTAEEPAFPDMQSLLISAFLDFEKGKPLAEVGGVICDALGLRAAYEEQIKDPKHRAILGVCDSLIRTLNTLIRPNLEKPFMANPPVDDAAPKGMGDAIDCLACFSSFLKKDDAAPKGMGDVIADLVMAQEQKRKEVEAQKKKDEIAEAFRQREEAILQAKEAADAKFQAEVVRVNGKPADAQNDGSDDDAMARFLERCGHDEDGRCIPLSDGGRKILDIQRLKQILAENKAKADAEHELAQKVRSHFCEMADKGDDFVEQLRQRIERRENKSN